MNKDEFQGAFSKEYWKLVDFYMSDDLIKFKRGLKKIINANERKLLQSRLLFSKGQTLEALSTCSTVSEYPAAYAGEKSFLLSTYYYSFRDYEHSTIEIQKAIEKIKPYNSATRLFKLFYNLSVNYSEMRWYALAEYALKNSEQYLLTTQDKVLTIRAKACLFSQKNQFNKALEQIEIGEKELKQIQSIEKNDFYLVAGDICTWAQDYQKALTYFSKIENSRNFHAKERLSCQMHFLKYILLDQGLILPKPPKTLTPNSEYFHQWQFLKGMQDGDLIQLNRTWQELKTIRPKVYGELFKSICTQESRNVFFQCIEKLRVKNTMNSTLPLRDLSPSLQKAWKVICESPTPLRKEELIEKIWNVRYSTEFDSRFYKLIERLKLKANARVIQKNRTYTFETL